MHYCQLDSHIHSAECSLLQRGPDFRKVLFLGFHAISPLVPDSSLRIQDLGRDMVAGTMAGTRQVQDSLHWVEIEDVV